MRADILLLVALTTLPAAAAPAVSSVIVAEGASLQLDGDSSLHRYSVKADQLDVSVGIEGARLAAVARPLDLEALLRGHFVTAFRVTVPVDALHSGRRGLDENLRKALRRDQSPQIRFWMESYDVAPSPAPGAAFVVVLHGRLSLAGVERTLDVLASGVRVPGGLRFSGSKALSMKDYRIEAPRLMLGAIKTVDAVTVRFSVTLRRS